jgi:2-dehydro-3-deoxyglucarate aldolase/4-hydroxy-2-oxoheptanedioate aldolase
MEGSTHFKDTLKRGDIALGTIISFNDPTITEALCRDLDFVWIDAEHSPMTLEIIQAHVMATKGSRATPIVRVPWNDPVLIKPILDLGAEGIIVPLVRTSQDAEKAVAACKYPPEGIRGYGPRRPSDYGRQSGPEFIKRMNDSVLVILQIEHIDAVNNIDQMLAVPGISSLVIGSNDLSGSLGLLGQPRHPQVLEAIDRVIAAARRASVFVGIGIGNDSGVINDWISKGMQWVAMGNDMSLLLTGLDQVSQEVRHFLHEREKKKGAVAAEPI